MVFQLSRTYHRIASEYSNAIHVDWFSGMAYIWLLNSSMAPELSYQNLFLLFSPKPDNLLAGEAASYFIMNAMKGEIPENIILSSSLFAIGRVLPGLEV